jgi:N utilization substance protein A
LTGFKIDIKSETQAREAGELDIYEEEYEETPAEEGAEEAYVEEVSADETVEE